MPKTNKGRTTDAETNLARRIEFEREKRDMSYEALAKAMTAVGCAIQATAIHKIEKGDKKTGKYRRITVNELTAFAEIFTEGDVAELLKPMELIEQEYAQELLETLQRNERNMMLMASDVFNVLVDIWQTKKQKPELYDYVMNHWFANPRGLSKEARADLHEGESLEEQVAFRAAQELRTVWVLGLLRAAGLWIEATTRELEPDEIEDVEQALAQDEPWIDPKGWLFELGEAEDVG